MPICVAWIGLSAVSAELMAGHAISSRLGFNPEFFPNMLEVTDE